MPNSLSKCLQLVDTPAMRPLLRSIVRGLEKESLRVTPAGMLAQTPHPSCLGSALCNPYITTDYSEALLEFITPPQQDIPSLLTGLDDLHRFTYQCLDEELLWTASMPCILRGDENIPVARYGHSNIGRMKTVYRLGLGYRYGRAMQTIAGIHYNFSLPDAFWESYGGALGNTLPLQAFKNQQYLALIRNFRRYAWLLIYLFGASPALCRSFLGDQAHDLDAFDQATLYHPHATALRMGKLGYQSSAQEGIVVPYNSLEAYIGALTQLLTRQDVTYQRVGTRGPDGQWRQLSTALLQIENEFYTTIRPKQPIRSGEAPILALAERGIEYVEVRALDVNPYLPLGIDSSQLRLLDLFLLYCLLLPSPDLDADEYHECQANVGTVVDSGRMPGLQLQRAGAAVSLQAWAGELLGGLAQIAQLLDGDQPGAPYGAAVQLQQRKLADPWLTPSGMIMSDLALNERSWYHFAMEQSQLHAEEFRRRPLSAERAAFFQDAARQSLEDQASAEQASEPPFEEFLQHYYQQYRRFPAAPLN